MVFSRVRNTSDSGASPVHSPSSFDADAIASLRAHARRTGGTNSSLLQELDSLLAESDGELQAEGLLGFAQRQEQAGLNEFSAEIYAALAGSGFAEPARRRAEARLGVLQGRGPFGARFELLARHFARQASDPAMLGAMALGGAVFQTTRLAVLSRLAASPTASLLTRGLGARALSWGAGFALEFPTFTFAARGLHEAMGVSQDWSRQAVGRDLLSSGLTLFLLKGSGAAGTSLVRRVEGSAVGTTAFARFSAAAIPQVAAYTGILGSHLLEARLGLRPHTDASSAMFESLATLLQFHVGGRILGHVTGNAYERNLDLLGRHLEGSRLLTPPPSGLHDDGTLSSLGLRPALAQAEAFDPRNTLILMSAKNPEETTADSPLLATHDGEAPPPLSPMKANSDMFGPMRTRLMNLGGEIYHLLNEQEGDTLWPQLSHRIALELHDHFSRLLDRNLPTPAHRPTLRRIIGELDWTQKMLVDLAQETDLSPHGALEVKEVLSALYRIQNKGVNYLDSGNRDELEGTLFMASDTRELLLAIYLRYRVNADAWDATWNDTKFLPRESIDPTDLQREVYVPPYDYRDPDPTPYFEIPGTNRKVVMLGAVPLERMTLSKQHRLEVIPFDPERRSRLASALVDNGDITRANLIWREWKRRTVDADYLEGYDIATAEELAGKQGERLLQELVFDRLRPGGMALIVSREAQALQRIVQLSTANQWADVQAGAFNAHLPVEVDREDLTSGNFVFLRKLPQF